MALKSVDDANGNGFDDELSSIEIAYLAKNFRNFLRNNNKREKGKNNTDKSKAKVSQTSNNSLGQQCFGCQGYGYVKSECPTFLRSKGKTMAVILSDDEIFDHESSSDDDENFIDFTATAVIDESVLVEENLSDGEFFESADLQEVYNKLCKVAAKDAMLT